MLRQHQFPPTEVYEEKSLLYINYIKRRPLYIAVTKH